jgi:hypothetical protein
VISIKGELLIEGDTGEVHSKSGIRAFVGIETFNKSVPSDDIALFSGYIADFSQKMTAYAGSVRNPENTESKWSLDYARSPCPMN